MILPFRTIFRLITITCTFIALQGAAAMLYGQANPLSVIDPEGIEIRVAAAQFELRPDLEYNLAKIDSFIEQAAKKKVDMLVFPELSLTGYPPSDFESIDYIDQAQTEAAMQALMEKAKKHSMAIVVGAGWKDREGNWRNRAFFIDENGAILATYDKIQQTSHERKFFIDGDRLNSFEWRGIRLGMLICMDMRYPELWRLLRKEDVGLMLHLVSAYGARAWKLPVLEGTLMCRAASNGFFIVSSNNAGPVPMMNSAIVNPRGIILEEALYAVEQMIWADIKVGKPDGFVDFKENVYQLKKAGE